MDIKTNRLLLRQLRDSDHEPFTLLNVDASGSWHMNDRIQSFVAEYRQRIWAVECRSNGEFIGFVGLHTNVSQLLAPPYLGIELGWRLASAYKDRNYRQEMFQAAFRVGLEFLNPIDAALFTATQNRRLQHMMSGIGWINYDKVLSIRTFL